MGVGFKTKVLGEHGGGGRGQNQGEEKGGTEMQLMKRAY